MMAGSATPDIACLLLQVCYLSVNNEDVLFYLEINTAFNLSVLSSSASPTLIISEKY